MIKMIIKFDQILKKKNNLNLIIKNIDKNSFKLT